jgi:hypothetical protein
MSELGEQTTVHVQVEGSMERFASEMGRSPKYSVSSSNLWSGACTSRHQEAESGPLLSTFHCCLRFRALHQSLMFCFLVASGRLGLAGNDEHVAAQVFPVQPGQKQIVKETR